MNDAADADYQSSASIVRWLPITILMIAGELSLRDGNLSFAGGLRKRTVFEAAITEFHSLAPLGRFGVHLWHNTTRYRLMLGNPVYVPRSAVEATPGVIGEVTEISGRLVLDSVNADLAQSWIGLLTPLIGAPPAGLVVKRPWPMWTWWLGILGFVALFVVAITVAVIFTS